MQSDGWYKFCVVVGLRVKNMIRIKVVRFVVRKHDTSVIFIHYYLRYFAEQ